LGGILWAEALGIANAKVRQERKLAFNILRHLKLNTGAGQRQGGSVQLGIARVAIARE
jgi:hypothetical protein